MENSCTALFYSVLFLFLRDLPKGRFYSSSKGCCRIHGIALFHQGKDLVGNLLSIGLVRVFYKHSNKLIPGDIVKSLCSRLSVLRVKSKVKGTIDLIRKAPLRIIYLHGGYSKVSQYKVKLTCFFADFIYIGKIDEPELKSLLIKACILKSLNSLFRLNRIHIKAIYTAASLKLFKHLPCMSAITKSTVKTLLSGLYLKDLQDLFYHNGYVHSCRS